LCSQENLFVGVGMRASLLSGAWAQEAMTAPDPRLEAVAMALLWAGRDRGFDYSQETCAANAFEFAAMYDAIRAFDEQQRTRPTPMDSLGDGSMRGPDESSAARSIVEQLRDYPSIQPEAPAASPVGADPPWLEACRRFVSDQCRERDDWGFENMARNILRFAAAQPPSDREIEQVMRFGPTRDAATAMLTAAARARDGR
jgi:hypothetical protein